MTKLTELYLTLAKAAQAHMPSLLSAPGLHPEKRTDKLGRTQTRHVRNAGRDWNQRNTVTRTPGPRTPINGPPRHNDTWGASPRKRGVTYMVSSSSSLEGRQGRLGVMVNARTTGRHKGVLEGFPWGMDNGAYSGHFDPETFMQALERFRDVNSNCRFVVSPDVLGDGKATETLLEKWREPIRQMGYPVAFVAHRGTTTLPNCDCLFIPHMNIDDPHIPRLIAQAKERGLWVHMGRVNSGERMRLCADMYCDSADGTHVKYRGLDKGLGEIEEWTDNARSQASHPSLFARVELPSTWNGSAEGRENRIDSIEWDRARARDRERGYWNSTPLYGLTRALPMGTRVRVAGSVMEGVLSAPWTPGERDAEVQFTGSAPEREDIRTLVLPGDGRERTPRELVGLPERKEQS